MSGMIAAKLPFSRIVRAEIYVNAGKRTLAEVKRTLGCDYIVNAGLFDMKTFAPASGILSGGTKYLTESYGISFGGGAPRFSYKNSVGAPYWIGAYPALLRSGARAFIATPSGLGGRRARTAVGIAGESLALLCVPEDAGVTLPELAELMRGLGCTDAVNLDGGGSTQCDLAGRTLASGRKVASFICIWTKGDEKVMPDDRKPPEFPGSEYFGDGKSNEYVAWLGKMLIKCGYSAYYSVGAGEKWSQSDKNACEAFQRDQGWRGADADGIPGRETWRRLTALYLASAGITALPTPVTPKNYAEKGVNSRSVGDLMPYVGYLCERLIARCAAEGVKLLVTGTMRDAEYQEYCYEIGASKTKLIGPHAFGLAFDVCIDDREDPYNAAKLRRAGEIGKSLGLEWGGDWRSFPDMPHFQYTGGLTDAKLRAGYRFILPEIPKETVKGE